MVMEEAVLIVLPVKMLLNLFSTESVVKIVETFVILGSLSLFATLFGWICRRGCGEFTQSGIIFSSGNRVSCEWFVAGLSFGDPRQKHGETRRRGLSFGANQTAWSKA
jgi:hypothetical protein